MHIMQELPTNKANFLIKTTQDFNSSRHAAPHLPIVFTDNIILYFNYKLFVLHVFKRSRNGMSWGGIVMQIFLLNAGILCSFDFTTVFQDGRQKSISQFGLVSILFLFQILIFYIN